MIPPGQRASRGDESQREQENKLRGLDEGWMYCIEIQEVDDQSDYKVKALYVDMCEYLYIFTVSVYGFGHLYITTIIVNDITKVKTLTNIYF